MTKFLSETHKKGPKGLRFHTALGKTQASEPDKQMTNYGMRPKIKRRPSFSGLVSKPVAVK